jgi:hypothetical protein
MGLGKKLLTVKGWGVPKLVLEKADIIRIQITGKDACLPNSLQVKTPAAGMEGYQVSHFEYGLAQVIPSVFGFVVREREQCCPSR